MAPVQGQGDPQTGLEETRALTSTHTSFLSSLGSLNIHFGLGRAEKEKGRGSTFTGREPQRSLVKSLCRIK